MGDYTLFSVFPEHIGPQNSSKLLHHLSLAWEPQLYKGRNRSGVLDLFIQNLSSGDGLPPYAQARIIDLISAELKKGRLAPYLWVYVTSPGDWYFQEIKRLVRYRIPTAVLPVGQDPFDDIEFIKGGLAPSFFYFNNQTIALLMYFPHFRQPIMGLVSKIP